MEELDPLVKQTMLDYFWRAVRAARELGTESEKSGARTVLQEFKNMILGHYEIPLEEVRAYENYHFDPSSFLDKDVRD